MSRPTVEKTGPTLFWSGRLLTWEDLRPHLAGLRELTVATRTIISPLVLDELRERKIPVKRGEAVSGAKASPSAQKPKAAGIALEQPDGLVASVIQALQKDGVPFQTWAPQGSNPAGWAWSLGLLVKENGQTGIAFVRDPALVACVAGKVSGVRPAQVINALQVTRAMKGYGANLLTVEIPGRTFFELKQILRAAATTVSASPADLERIFKELDGHAHR